MNSQGYQLVIAALIGGAISVFTTWLNNRFQLQREYQQWLRQQEAEQRKWYREQMHEIYKQCIFYLTKVIRGPKTGDVSKTTELCTEAEKYLVLLLANYPDKDSENFQTLVETIKNFESSGPERFDLAKDLRIRVSTLMLEDPRVNSQHSTLDF